MLSAFHFHLERAIVRRQHGKALRRFDQKQGRARFGVQAIHDVFRQTTPSELRNFRTLSRTMHLFGYLHNDTWREHPLLYS
jgi:hypothetical protein